MGELSATNITLLFGEPRIQDITMRVYLGIKTLQRLRRLIESNKEELQEHGRLFQVVTIPESGARSSKAFYLNRFQACLVCMFADVSATRDARRKISAIFDNWTPEPGAITDSVSKWNVKDDGLSVALGQGKASKTAIDLYRSGKPEEYVRAISFLPILRNCRLKWWRDNEVRSYLILAYGQRTIDQAVAEITAMYGAERAPTRSSVGRFWLTMGRIFDAGA